MNGDEERSEKREKKRGQKEEERQECDVKGLAVYKKLQVLKKRSQWQYKK